VAGSLSNTACLCLPQPWTDEGSINPKSWLTGWLANNSRCHVSTHTQV
jgi:hypothetical protein